MLWYRYFDDVFFIWTHGEEKFSSFLNVLINYHPNIKFTHASNKEHIRLLDLNMKLLANNLSTDLYIESTERHQYLQYISSHPEHMKKSVIYSQVLRLSRICSEEQDFVKHVCELKSWFSKRGYPQKLIETKTSKVKSSGQRVFHGTKVEKGVSLVVTYTPCIYPLAKLFMITYICYI